MTQPDAFARLIGTTAGTLRVVSEALNSFAHRNLQDGDLDGLDRTYSLARRQLDALGREIARRQRETPCK